MPILRVGGDDQGRIRQDDRAFDPEVQKIRRKVQPPHRNDLRLKEDPPFSEWAEYLVHLFQFHLVRTSSYDNKNAVTTGFYWLSKAFPVLDGFQSGMAFSGKAWIDETYYLRWKSEAASKGGKLLKGLSRNQFCVCLITDGRRCALRLCGVGKPSSRKAMKAYADLISPGSTIVHNGDNSHNAL